MSDNLEEMTAIVEKCFADIRQASVMYDIAWHANDEGLIPKALEGSLAGHAYQQIFFALMESSALALLRFLDNQNRAAHLDSFLKAIDQPETKRGILAAIRTWPTTFDDEDAYRELSDTLNEIAEARNRIAPQIKKFHTYRNSSLAHAQIKRKGELPTFDELRHVIDQCEVITEHMKRLVTGVVADISDWRDIYRRSADDFWRALTNGLGALPKP